MSTDRFFVRHETVAGRQVFVDDRLPVKECKALRDAERKLDHSVVIKAGVPGVAEVRLQVAVAVVLIDDHHRLALRNRAEAPEHAVVIDSLHDRRLGQEGGLEKMGVASHRRHPAQHAGVTKTHA